jgi:hypothetical protein
MAIAIAEDAVVSNPTATPEMIVVAGPRPRAISFTGRYEPMYCVMKTNAKL